MGLGQSVASQPIYGTVVVASWESGQVLDVEHPP